MILTRSSRSCTGNFFIDDDVLAEAGVKDFGSYRNGRDDLGLEPDLFRD